MTADIHPRADNAAPSETPGIVLMLTVLTVLTALVLMFV